MVENEICRVLTVYCKNSNRNFVFLSPCEPIRSCGFDESCKEAPEHVFHAWKEPTGRCRMQRYLSNWQGKAKRKTHTRNQFGKIRGVSFPHVYGRKSQRRVSIIELTYLL